MQVGSPQLAGHSYKLLFKVCSKHHGNRQDGMINSFWMELGKFYQKNPLLEIDHQEEEGLSQKREFQENEYL